MATVWLKPISAAELNSLQFDSGAIDERPSIKSDWISTELIEPFTRAAVDKEELKTSNIQLNHSIPIEMNSGDSGQLNIGIHPEERVSIEACYYEWRVQAPY